MDGAVREFGNAPQASLAGLDGFRQIMAGVVLQAINDLTNKDPIVSTGALGWLLSDDAPIWLEAATGQDLDSETFFLRVAKGGLGYARKFQSRGGFSQSTKGASRQNESN